MSVVGNTSSSLMTVVGRHWPCMGCHLATSGVVGIRADIDANEFIVRQGLKWTFMVSIHQWGQEIRNRHIGRNDD